MRWGINNSQNIKLFFYSETLVESDSTFSVPTFSEETFSVVTFSVASTFEVVVSFEEQDDRVTKLIIIKLIKTNVFIVKLIKDLFVNKS